MYLQEIIHCFTCIFCNGNWSIALHLGAEHNIINQRLYCPWCGDAHVYVTDEEYK